MTKNFTTTADLAIPPSVAPSQPTAKSNAVKPGYSGEQVVIVLAAGAEKHEKEAQFARVNEDTWLVPRNKEVTLPVEAYEALKNTIPPQPEGVSAVFAPRFSISVVKRIPAPQAA